MNRSLLFLLALCLLIQGYAQRPAPVGGWTSYLSHNYVNDLTQRGTEIWGATTGGLFMYDFQKYEVSTYTKIEGLYSINPVAIYADPATGYILCGYPDGMVNAFQKPEEIRTISDIARTTSFPNKRIYAFQRAGDNIFIATDFGLVSYNIGAFETREAITKVGTLNTGIPVYDVTFFHDSLWLSMGTHGVWAASIYAPNLSAPSAWGKVSGSAALPDGMTDLIEAGNDSMFVVIDNNVYARGTGGWTFAGYPTQPYRDMAYANGRLGLIYFHNLVYRTAAAVQDFDSYTELLEAVWPIDINHVFVGDKVQGLNVWEFGAYRKVVLPGPRNNYVTQIAAGDGELYIAPRGQSGPSGRFYDPSGYYYYTPVDGWENPNCLTGLPDSRCRDFCRVIRDKQSETTYYGSWGDGITVVKNGDTVTSFTGYNSGLSGLTATDNRVSGLALDEQGALWVTLMLGNNDSILNMRNTDGQWYSFRFPSTVYPIGLVIDDFGTKWIINQRIGLVAFSDNNTPGNPADDRYKYMRTSDNQGLPSDEIRSLAIDKNGQLWIGTALGVVVISDPGSVFTSSFRGASCPVYVNRCLLKDDIITAIAIDGANRKWIGTENGVFLLNPDGTEQIAVFNTDNSPLISNIITDIEVDQQTGEVFIGTENGLISYMGDATEGADNSDAIFAFPNPFVLNGEAPLTINGLVDNATVKITTVSGLLVREITANGGTVVWNGTDIQGNYVATGVYLVMVAGKDGVGPGITKVAVIRP